MVSFMLKHVSPARWLVVCLACLAIAFVAHTIYSRRVAGSIDAHVRSISKNSAPSVVHLAQATEDIRLIASRAMLARTESVSEDRAAIRRWVEDMEDAVRRYRLTEDRPVEHDVFVEVEKRRTPFLTAVDATLDTVRDRRELHEASLEQLTSTADDLAGMIRVLTRLNAEQLANEGATIERIGQRARDVFFDLRAVTLLLAVVGVLLALTASRQHVALVEDSRRMAEARAGELEMFAGRVAHDLRAPLAVIEMRSSSRFRAEPADALRETLDRVARQGRRMDEIINALLAFAQAGAEPELETCSDVADVVDEIIADARSIASVPSLEVVIEPIPAVNVASSRGVLAIVLSNLVHNAAKYIVGGEGPPRITVRLNDDDDGALRFEVQDTGPGLPPGAEHIVFQPFVRVGTTVQGGIGLGLATVKKLVEAHEGTVGVVSTPGRGCRFWFELPRAHHWRDSNPEDAPSKRAFLRTDGTGRRLRQL
jgi:signal transduction histidine kinase